MALKTTTEPTIDLPAITATAGKTSTVSGFDPTDTAKDKWFKTSKPRSDVFGGTEVIPYMFGKKLFPDIVAAMRTATTADHFILIAGWNLSDSASRKGLGAKFQLDPADATSTLENILNDADKGGAKTRALLFRHDSSFGARDNTDVITFINGLKNGAAVHDEHVVLGLDAVRPLVSALAGHWIGSHHQKVIAVNGSEGLVAFQGGYDLDQDRLSGFGGDGLHDVHTRIRGTGAKVVADVFVERWNDHASVTAAQKLAAIPFPTPLPKKTFVQVTHTYPNPTKHALNGGGTYSYATSGETTAKELLINAIGKAEKFIYVEDQYLFDMDISDALKGALGKIQKLVILIVSSPQIADETLQPFARRKKFIDNLPASYTVSAGAPATTTYSGKVAVCELTGGRYVHSKTWIFDDRFAIIGSANCNRRGYTHDTEQTMGVFDVNEAKRWFFAHELRMNLWAKHLGKTPIDFVDPIGSSVHWFTPIGNVTAYNPNGGPDPDPKGDNKLKAAGLSIPFPFSLGVTPDTVWDGIIDPDGT